MGQGRGIAPAEKFVGGLVFYVPDVSAPPPTTKLQNKSIPFVAGSGTSGMGLFGTGQSPQTEFLKGILSSL